MDMRERILRQIGSWKVTQWIGKKLMVRELRKADKAPEVQKRFKALSGIAPDTLEHRKADAEYFMAFVKELEKSRFYAWPPGSAEIQNAMERIETGVPTASEIEEFRRLASQVMQHPRCNAAFKKRIEAALSLVERP